MMFRSQPAQFFGFTLLGLAVAGFVLTQMFQCSVSTQLVEIDPDDFFDASMHPLTNAIYNGGSVTDVEVMLQNNPDWAIKPIYFDWYAVHCAGQAGRPDILQALLDHGANINVRGPNNVNVIVGALESENPQTLAFVLDMGADPHIKMVDGKTPLDYVREIGDTAMQRVLEERGLP